MLKKTGGGETIKKGRGGKTAYAATKKKKR